MGRNERAAKWHLSKVGTSRSYWKGKTGENIVTVMIRRDELESLLQKFPAVRQSCKQRQVSNALNGDALSAAQESIADAINEIVKGAKDSDRGRMEIAITHLAMAHVFAQAMKRHEKEL